MINTYVFVLLSGKRLEAKGIDEFNAFLSIMKPDAVDDVDYYGILTRVGLRDIKGSDYLNRGLNEFILEQDAAVSLVIDERRSVEEESPRLYLSETEPNTDPSSHDEDFYYSK